MVRVSGYEYDIFISYAREGSAQKWLLNHFLSKLKECLADEIAPKPRVYVDREMERGVHWPSSLQRALLHSKIMLQVLAPPTSSRTGAAPSGRACARGRNGWGWPASTRRRG